MSIPSKPRLLATSVSLALCVAYGAAASEGVQVESFDRFPGDLNALKENARNPIRVQETEYFIVQLKEEPLATYAGAYSQVSTMADGSETRPQLNLQSIQAREHESFLHVQQRSFVSQIQRRIPQAQMHRQFATVMNAVALEVPKGTSMQEISSMPQVERVYRNEMRYTQMDSSLDLINVADSWASAGGRDNAGEGIRVAVIDGGIRPENPMFAGTNLAPATGLPTDDYCSTTDASFCTDKLIVARYSEPTFLVNDAEYMSPLDLGGHGTHVAGTAVGERTTASIQGGEVEVSGVAPGAYLMVYKALFQTPDERGSGSDVMLVEALEHAIEDGADVINNSWGGGPGMDGTGSVYNEIFTNAEAAGVMIVTAAGNDGPGYQTVGCPGCVEAGLTVAASSTGRSFSSSVTYGSEVWSATPGSGDFSLTEEVTATFFLAENVDEENILGCSAYPDGSLDGSIVLVDRGECAFTDKATNAQAAGAVAIIVGNNEEGTISMSMPGVTLPSVSILQEDAAALREAYSEGSEITVGALESVIDETQVNTLADFSSRGQNGNNSFLKPEITAPGVAILSADSPDRVGEFGQKSGTSMASPHVAGAAAVLRQLRPELDAYEIKSILMGTAINDVVNNHDNESLATPFGQGAGLLNVAGAENANFVIDGPSLVDPACQSSCDLERTITNISDAELTLTVEAAQFSNRYVTATFATEGGDASELLELTIAAGESATFTTSIDSRFADDGWNFGSIHVSAGADSTQTFPIAIASERQDDARVLTTTVTSGEPTWGSLAEVETRFSSPLNGEEVSLTVDLPENFEATDIEVSETSATGTHEVTDGVLTWTGTFQSAVDGSGLVAATGPSGSILDMDASALLIAPSPFGCSAQLCDEVGIPLTGLGDVGGITFNGTNYSSITVFDNGLIAAGDQSATQATFENLELPSTENPNNLIAPFWTDLVIGGAVGGEMYFAVAAFEGTDYLVIEWNEAKLWTSSVSASDPSYTLSVWLPLGEEQNDILFNYTAIPAIPTFLSVGMEDISGSSGFTYHYNGDGGDVTEGSALAGQLLVQDSGVVVNYDLPLEHAQHLTAETQWNTEVTIDVLDAASIVADQSMVTASALVDEVTYNSRAPLIIEPTGNVGVELVGSVEGGDVSVSNGVISFTPDKTFKGEQVIRYVLSDEASNTSSEYEVTVTVAPRDADKWYEGSLGWLFMCFVAMFGYRRFNRK